MERCDLSSSAGRRGRLEMLTVLVIAAVVLAVVVVFASNAQSSLVPTPHLPSVSTGPRSTRAGAVPPRGVAEASGAAMFPVGSDDAALQALWAGCVHEFVLLSERYAGIGTRDASRLSVLCDDLRALT